jgi:valyl-tRNA synthetase
LPDSISVNVRTTEFYIPMTMKIDHEEEIRKLEEELAYTKGFLETVMKKLSNERFVNSAPAHVVDAERKKKSDADARIKVLEEKIKELMS